MRKQDFTLRLAREICQKLVERRLLGSAQVADSLEWLGRSLRPLAEAEEAMPFVNWAREITLRLIEQGRLRTPQAVFETLSEIVDKLKEIASRLNPEKASEALWASVDLALKLLEVHFVSQAQLFPAIESLAVSAEKVLPGK